MARLALAAALMLTMLGTTVHAESGAQKAGNFLSSLLGMRGPTAAEPLKLTSDPTTRPKDVRAPLTLHDASKAKPAEKQKSAAKPQQKLTPKAQAKAAPAVPAAEQPAPTAQTAALDQPAAEPVKPKRPLGPFRGGGSQPVCVRTCDGFFFPVNYEGAHSNDRYEEACASSCPAARTEVYFMQRGADLTTAATARGERYTQLSTAFRYRKERDAACTCKSETQTWAEVLKPVDSMVKHHKNDVVVTPEKSMELSRPVEPDLAKAEEALKASTVKPVKKTGDKREAKAKDKKPRQQANGPKPDLMRGDVGGPWRTTNKFIKVDPEPTASIRTSAE